MPAANLPTPKVTIKDIARRADVSISTVSRVLNHSDGVAEDKRAAVMQAIAELDYRPNLFAQGLAGGQSRTIGILTQVISSPLYDTILRGILEGLDGSGYSPLIADGSWIPEKELAALQTFLGRAVDGLVVLGGNLGEEALTEMAAATPMILIARDIAALKAQCIPLDDFQGAYLATQHLIEAGHRRIAHIAGVIEHKDAARRQEGYFQALRHAGLAVDPELAVMGDYTEPSGILCTEMLLMRGRVFSAIFAANDQMAYGARLALYRRGIRVPEDISIIGFDDQATSAFMTPPLTSVRVPALDIGHVAASGLLALIHGESCALLEFPPRLAIRESVARR